MTDSKERHRQLAREYKEKKKQIGVFAIRNKTTGRVFIDHTLHLDKAYNKHRFQLNMGSHQNKLLQSDWTKDGEENFLYEVIEELEELSNDSSDISKDLAELKELCREKLAGMSGVNGFY